MVRSRPAASGRRGRHGHRSPVRGERDSFDRVVLVPERGPPAIPRREEPPGGRVPHPLVGDEPRPVGREGHRPAAQEPGAGGVDRPELPARGRVPQADEGVAAGGGDDRPVPRCGDHPDAPRVARPGGVALGPRGRVPQPDRAVVPARRQGAPVGEKATAWASVRTWRMCFPAATSQSSTRPPQAAAATVRPSGAKAMASTYG